MYLIWIQIKLNCAQQQAYGCLFLLGRGAYKLCANGVMYPHHQWSSETLKGPISIFHLPSYDNKICKAEYNKQSESPTYSLMTSQNRDTRTNGALMPNDSLDRLFLIKCFIVIVISVICTDFTHAVFCTSFHWIPQTREHSDKHSAFKRNLILWKSPLVKFNTPLVYLRINNG